MYLESFCLPVDQEQALIKARMAHNGGALGYLDNAWPCGLFAAKGLYEIRFDKVTVLYGDNGSGKSTLLNLIAAKLDLNRVAPFNSGEMFADYVSACRFATGYDDEGFREKIPNKSRIITSDDIFDYMLTVRANNDEISESVESARDEWAERRFGDTVKLRGMEDYEALRLQVLARRKSVSRRKFIRRTVGEEVKLNSNGETALLYFESKLKNDTLYCLDEPENSLSPRLQIKLAAMIEEMARYCGCQLIIATHSPFLLAISGARVYDLDARPVVTRPWWELENVREYYAFFDSHREKFRDASRDAAGEKPC